MPETAIEKTRPTTKAIQKACHTLRQDIQATKVLVSGLAYDPIFGEPDIVTLSPGNLPATQNLNMLQNIMKAFSSLEDARMRLGKVLQATHGGTSIYTDKKNE